MANSYGVANIKVIGVGGGGNNAVNPRARIRRSERVRLRRAKRR